MRLKNKLLIYKRINTKRLFSYLLDIVVIKIFSFCLSASFIETIRKISLNGFYISFESYSIAHEINYTITYITYFFICFYVYDGETLGLKALGLRVKRTSITNRLKFIECLNRAFTNFLCHKLSFVLFTVPIFRDDNKGLPDILSNSQTCFNANKDFMSKRSGGTQSSIIKKAS